LILKENSLCTRDNDGNRVQCPGTSDFLLDCMCGNIIRGRFDPALPFFTTNGSFWCNHTTALLAGTTPEHRQADTRNYCNSRGYESVALIPVKARDNRTGLIQLNDHRADMFTLDLIEYMEMIGEQIGLALNSSMTYEKLKQALADAKVLRGLIPICACCKKIKDDKGYWNSVEVYIRNHSEAEFTHGYCPECTVRMLAEIKSQGAAP